MRTLAWLLVLCMAAWVARKMLVAFSVGALETVCRAVTLVSAVRG